MAEVAAFLEEGDLVEAVVLAAAEGEEDQG